MTADSPQLTLPETPEPPAPPVLDGAPWSAALEALLFAADRPLGAEEIAQAATSARELEVDAAEVRRALGVLRDALDADPHRGFELVEIAGGWQLRTRPEHADLIHALYRKKPVRLSRAAMETLAIIAYRQPCTRADIDEIRGVDSSSTLRQLLERDLVRILGKADDVGRPLLYGTTDTFLAFFGLPALSALPTLREFTELTEDHVVKLQAWEEALRPPGSPDGEPERLEPLPDDTDASHAQDGEPPDTESPSPDHGDA